MFVWGEGTGRERRGRAGGRARGRGGGEVARREMGWTCALRRLCAAGYGSKHDVCFVCMEGRGKNNKIKEGRKEKRKKEGKWRKCKVI